MHEKAKLWLQTWKVNSSVNIYIINNRIIGLTTSTNEMKLQESMVVKADTMFSHQLLGGYQKISSTMNWKKKSLWRKYLIKIHQEEPAHSWSQKHGSSMTPNPSKTNDNNIWSSHFLLRLKAKELNIPNIEKKK